LESIAVNYPVVIHKDKSSDYGVTVPDLPGCFSAGRTIDEALTMAKEAVELHLEGLVEEGQAIPQPGTIDDYQTRREFRDGVWALVSVDESTLRIKVVRLNITMPERVLDAVDRYAAVSGNSRSGLLVRAVSAYMGREADRPKKPGRVRRRNKKGRKDK
jgi:predicted RNase H-like HicB family nuclease